MQHLASSFLCQKVSPSGLRALVSLVSSLLTPHSSLLTPLEVYTMNATPGLPDLRVLAHKAMVERGLQPEFSLAAMQQLRGISGPAGAAAPAVRDLRKWCWCSID